MRKIIWHHGAAGCTAASDFHENNLLSAVTRRNVRQPGFMGIPGCDHVLQRFSRPVRYAEICGGANVIQFIPPGDIVLVAMIRVIDQGTVIAFFYFADGGSPVRFLGFRAQHFTADTEHLATRLLRDLSVMTEKSGIGGKPVFPGSIRTNFRPGEIDVSTPDSICTIDHGFHTDFQSLAVKPGNGSKNILVGNSVTVVRTDNR